MARYVIKNDATSVMQQKIFKPDEDQHIRRLANFAILGHQTAINGRCVTTEKKRCCEEATAKQRMGAIAKAWKHILQEGKRQD